VYAECDDTEYQFTSEVGVTIKRSVRCVVLLCGYVMLLWQQFGFSRGESVRVDGEQWQRYLTCFLFCESAWRTRLL